MSEAFPNADAPADPDSGDGLDHPDTASMKFEHAIDYLEQIIERIESGEADLEQCLAGYERGMQLIGRCRSILDTAEKRIAELASDSSGQLHVKPGEGGQDDAEL